MATTFNYTQLVNKTRDVFRSGRTKNLKWRKQQLKSMLKMLDDNRDRFIDALHKDLRKHKNEGCITEIDFARNDLIDTINQLDTWAKPEYVKKNLMTMRDDAFIKSEPFGVALIMGAWNYPVQLTIMPMVGAICAGNAVVLKPSELAENVAQLLEDIIPKYLDKECFHVVNGAIPETTALLEERFDYIFYTGNSQVARIVARAASKHLTPMTLELGGKSPCYIHPDSDINLVSRRLIWGKFTNAGQTCIAPDYVLCNKEVQAKLIDRLKVNLKAFYGSDPQKSDSLSRIINNRHFNRVKGLLEGANIAIGGEMDEKDSYIAPTVIVDCKPTDPAMENEIFGPVLPVMNVKNEEEAISFINSREKPLAMYVFSKDKNMQHKFLDQTSSGGFTGNDTLMHCSLTTLPFGGVGDSGQGGYHGKFSFDRFSHKRAVLLKQQALEKINDVRYPPYTVRKGQLAEFVLKKKLKEGGILNFWPLIVLGTIIGFLAKYLKK